MVPQSCCLLACGTGKGHVSADAWKRLDLARLQRWGVCRTGALALVFPRIAVISPLLVSSLLQSRFNIEAKWVFLKYKPDSVPILLKMLW